MRRDELLAEVQHAQEEVELGAGPHRPQHVEGPGADLVHPAPCGIGDGRAGRDDGQLMIQAGADAVQEPLPLADAGRAAGAARAGDVAHEEAHLLPAPGQHRPGEGGVGAPDRAVRGRGTQLPQGHGEHRGARRHAPAEGARGQVVEPDDQPRAEPPDEQRIGRGTDPGRHGRRATRREPAGPAPAWRCSWGGSDTAARTPPPPLP